MVIDLNLKTSSLTNTQTNKQRRKGSTNTQYVLIVTNNKAEHIFVNFSKRIILTYFSMPSVFIYFINNKPTCHFKQHPVITGEQSFNWLCWGLRWYFTLGFDGWRKHFPSNLCKLMTFYLVFISYAQIHVYRCWPT